MTAPSVRRLLPLLAPLLLAAGGCASPTTGRVRDAHLLWSPPPGQKEVASYEQLGPFWERVETPDGAVRRSVRPFVWTDIRSAEAGVEHKEILWPVWSRDRRADQVSWRFLCFFGMDKDVTGEGSPQDRSWIFPLWFSGTSKAGEDYAALFPVHGTIREMFWDRISFTLFPLWATWDRNDCHTWSVLWPFVQRQTGPGRDAWRVIPFWGHTTVEGRLDARFAGSTPASSCGRSGRRPATRGSTPAATGCSGRSSDASTARTRTRGSSSPRSSTSRTAAASFPTTARSTRPGRS